MPHAEVDVSGINDFLSAEDLAGIGDLNELNERELDLGEKANDAEDYGDISDEDLAEDETEVRRLQTEVEPKEEEDDPFDDLFGDEAESPIADVKEEDATFGDSQGLHDSIETIPFDEAEPEEEDAETREQRLLFEQARREREERMRRADSSIDAIPSPTTNDELFNAIWPQFQQDRPLRFSELLPGKKAYYLKKAPLKPPRPVHPTKVNLDLEPDQEKTFKTLSAPTASLDVRLAEAQAKGLIPILQEEGIADSSEDEDFDLLEEPEDVGGVSWQDLVAICHDWDIPDDATTVVSEVDLQQDGPTGDLFLEDDFDTLENSRPSKRQKTLHTDSRALQQLHNINIAFESPEKATSKLAKRVHLDLNDSRLLIDEHVPMPHEHRRAATFKRDMVGGMAKDFARRYNISNDEEYDLLKQNHQNRVRSQLGNAPIEHAGPAVRLQYPFYKQQLTRKEARSWHRPMLNVTPGDVLFKKHISHKRKHMRGKPPQEIFVRAADMTIGDNSSLMLFEYSEETPPMLSSFGMGSRLINYYRRKDEQDTARPKLDVGETSVLLPQDKSPFDIFGDVAPGQTTPTLSNFMYRAPVFRHNPQSTDFIVSRSSTGLDGSVWRLRNIEGLHVVGQEFPYQEVPGPKARYSTNVAKARLQMVSYRMYNRSRGKLSMDMIRKHNPHTDVPTIRTKMREFMNFDKSAGQGRGIWVPKMPGDMPDESGIRGLVKPEDVALLYAMQVGQQHLSDAGYHKQGDEDADDEDEDGDKSAGNIDRQLAPWNTTKNFLLSCTDKAMIEVYGEGDPTGRGEALSMIKTSMKGGFKAVGQSIEDRLDAQRQKELGGHKYNVARQKQEYAEAIHRVWEAQARSLSSVDRREDADAEMNGVEESPTIARNRTPNSGMGKSRHDDETASAFSKASSLDQTSKVMRITRTFKDKYGHVEVVQEIVRDPNIIREYRRRRRLADLEKLSFAEMNPTGDPEQDAARKRMMQQEIERLYRNVDRHNVREKAKMANAGSPGDGGSAEDEAAGAPKRRNLTGTTQRKCANCGQVGHIKTNKKLCPKLNGTDQQSEAASGSAFGAISTAAPAVPQTPT